ncbi:protein Mpv17-like [Diabrotica virgifera virgifera]|uniref:Mitochondrial inner membrane protein Mpv17 n=1 Tax=Diabrotica virgifera virgifera TaxID=50390 RepID=A0ABM5K2X0_DIAVI|nr:protein Mpv17-like [Diabrotica virgifera virgifera]
MYKHLSKHKIMIRHSLEVTCLMTIGDLVAQCIVDKKPISQINLNRTLKFGSLGFILVGPCMSAWYKFLTVSVNAKDPRAPIKKMLMDQLIFAPSMLPIVMTAVGMYVNNYTWKKTKNEIRNKYFDILITNYQVWPIVQLVNFKYVPYKYQVLVAQCVGIFWNSYLSWKTVSK